MSTIWGMQYNQLVQKSCSSNRVTRSRYSFSLRLLQDFSPPCWITCGPSIVMLLGSPFQLRAAACWGLSAISLSLSQSTWHQPFHDSLIIYSLKPSSTMGKIIVLPHSVATTRCRPAPLAHSCLSTLY